MRVADWLPFSCGNRVRLKSDPRHVGTVRAIMHGAFARVRWDDTGWLSDEKFKRLELVQDNDPEVPNEHDFTGEMEDWEDRVFLNADHFRLHRYYGIGAADRAEVKSFARAIVLATEAMDEGKRVIVYAVTATGRFVALPQKRWDHFAQLWLSKREG